MSFPTAYEPAVSCNGFPTRYLPAIRSAIENKQVIWGETNLFIDSCLAEFNWVNCIWELEEVQEMVTSITLLKGTLNDEELTVAVLKG